MLTAPFTLLSMAWRGLRARWATFAATIAALALGVGLVAAMGQVLAGTFEAPGREPARYGAAPVVVRAAPELRVQTQHKVATQPLDASGGLSAALLDRLAATGAVTVDHVFEVGTGQGAATGRSWATAGCSGTTVTDGRAPAGDDEIVLATGKGRVGEQVTVYADPSGPRTYTVAGTAPPVGGERTVYFTAAESARLHPAADVAVVDAPAESVETAVGEDAEVLTGQERAVLDPATERDEQALISANILVSTAGGVAAFVSVFVVASTFAFAVAQRRREFALLRAAGATARQVRRTVIAEAVLLGLAGSALGCLLGDRGGEWLAAWLRDLGMAPPWFTVGTAAWPLCTAFAIGVVVAWAGAFTASRRAGAVRPTEALREVRVERRGLHPVRWIAGLAALAGAVAMTVQPLLGEPAALLKRKQYMPLVFMLLIALATLAPLLVPPITRLLTRPLARLRGATGVLARESALAASARTAATAAPILLTVGLAVCLLGVTTTVESARTDEATERVTAAYLVLPDRAPELTPAMADAARAVPGAEVAVTSETTLFEVEEDTALLRRQARAVDAAAFGTALSVPVLAGDPAALDDASIVVDTEWGREVGEDVNVWRADGTPVTLRVVAVIRQGVGGNGAYVTTANAPGAHISELFVDPGTQDVDALRARLGELGAELVGRDAWTERQQAEAGGPTRLGIRVILGVALAYTGLFVVGTLAMSTRDRRRELELLRLAGATKGQTLRALAAETGLVVAVGTALAAIAGAVVLGGAAVAVWMLSGSASVEVPWLPVAGVVAACAAAAMGTALLVAGVGAAGRGGAGRSAAMAE